MSDLIRDKFKQWLKTHDTVTFQEAKGFYDSVASGNPKWTGTAVNRLLAEFAQSGDGDKFVVKKRKKPAAGASAINPVPAAGASKVARDYRIVLDADRKPSTQEVRLFSVPPRVPDDSKIKDHISEGIAHLANAPDKALDVRFVSGKMIVILRNQSPEKAGEVSVWVGDVKQHGLAKV